MYEMRMNPSLWNLPCRQAGINQDVYLYANSPANPTVRRSRSDH